jgi:hypothetical protein
VLAKVDQSIRQAQIAHQVESRLRYEHLVAVAGGRDARGPVNGHADVSACTRCDFTGVNARPYTDSLASGPGMGGQRLLCVGCGGECFGRPAEGDHERIAFGPLFVSAVPLKRGPQQLTVRVEDAAVCLSPKRLEHPRGPLDIREQERDDA